MKQPSSMTVVSEANWVPKASSAAAAPAEDETPIAALMRRIVSSAHSCLSGLTGAAALPSESVKKAFETFDRNGNGSLDADELRSALAYIGFNTSAAHTREMLARYDTSLRDGKLDLNEFARLVYDLNSAAQPPTFTKQTSSVVAQPPSAASASIASSAAATAALARPGSAEAFAAQQKAEAAKQPTRSAAEWDVQQKAAAEKEQAAKQELARVAAAAERRASQAAAADEKKEAEKAAAEKAAAERIAAHQLKKEPSAKHEERLATGQVPIVAGFQVAVKQDDPGDAAKAAGQEKAKAAAAAAKAAAEKAAAAQAAAQAARAKAAMMRSASVAAALQAGVPAAPAAPEGGSGAVGGSGAAAPSFAVGSRVYVKRSSGEESIGFITEYDRAKQVYTLELDQRGSGKVKQCVEKDLRPAPENAAHAEPAGADIPVQHRTRHRVNFEPGPLGMGLEMSTDGWVMVSDVKEGQAAAQHGVLKGSYILEVNGEKCDGLVQADVTNLLRKAGAREVLFALPLRKK
ncbi:calmodulin [Chrysochromulina tobinii]|uniref:Calmodulin n=1 Tax=Chrysochromulina tobinii TaxID=1460289 RepID=A0A0M0K8N1_9EUKA|nr:calmodulin [Chrysochromulina tobinii]|eukprot:KOO35216.1 calmodulin [Chrysochromulina sp. CCMP291]